MPGCLEWNHKISPIDAFYENAHAHAHIHIPMNNIISFIVLKPQDSFGKKIKLFLDLQKVQHTVRKHW